MIKTSIQIHNINEHTFQVTFLFQFLWSCIFFYHTPKNGQKQKHSSSLTYLFLQEEDSQLIMWNWNPKAHLFFSQMRKGLFSTFRELSQTARCSNEYDSQVSIIDMWSRHLFRERMPFKIDFSRTEKKLLHIFFMAFEPVQKKSRNKEMKE